MKKIRLWIKILRSKRFYYRRIEIYKKIAQALAIEEMLKKNSELLNTILTCKIEDEEDFDLDTIFQRCECITRFLKEHKQIILQELMELDHRAYVAVVHESVNYSKNFVVKYDEEWEVEFPIPTFLSNKKNGIEYQDINAITLSLDYYRKNMREMLRVVK